MFRPNYESATAYGSAWLGEIARLAQEMGHAVIDIEGIYATPEAFYQALTQYRPDFVVAMGHGAPNAFGGQNGQIVLQGCTNDQMMAGTQAYFVSCLMAQKLVPSMVSKGAYGVAGYSADFVWNMASGYLENPLDDPKAYPFMRALVDGTRVILEHLRTSPNISPEAWRRFYLTTVDLFNQGIQEWRLSPSPDAIDIVNGLEQDKNSLVILGEGIQIMESQEEPLPLVPLLVGLGLFVVAML